MDTLDSAGYAVVDAVIDNQTISQLRVALETVQTDTSQRRNGSIFAPRNLLQLPEIAALAASTPLRSLVEPILSANCFAVRGILFDKTPDANWLVTWHQDLSITVQERNDVEGFAAWSVKAGVTHVQPPVALLETMLTVRLHLDDCPATNGALQVFPGSHRLGRLTAPEIATYRDSHTPTLVTAQAGCAVLVRPLLLHASSAATMHPHRRVIHIEFAHQDLPDGLAWFCRVR